MKNKFHTIFITIAWRFYDGHHFKCVNLVDLSYKFFHHFAEENLVWNPYLSIGWGGVFSNECEPSDDEQFRTTNQATKVHSFQQIQAGSLTSRL